MLVRVKSEVRKALSAFGFDIQRVDKTRLTGVYLEQDLPVLVGIESPVIVDVGANKGQRIDFARRIFRNPQITSFEPNPELTGLLRSNYSGVTIVEAAVGNVESELDFHIYANDRLSSLRDLDEQKAHLSHGNVQPRLTVKVPVVRLDSYWREHRATTGIDILFIDAQGFDREVLEGAEGLLKNGKIGIIVTDVYCSQYYKDQHNYLGEIEPWLRQKGFGLVGLYEILRDGPVISAAAACFRRMPDANSKTARRPV